MYLGVIVLELQSIFVSDFERRLMETEEDEVRQERIMEARARNISHNVRCTERGSQPIEDSQAYIAIFLCKLIRNEIRGGKSNKKIYEKLEYDFGETVLYALKFDMQTAALWLSPLVKCLEQLLIAGAAGGIWGYKKYMQKNNVHIMALNLVRGVLLNSKGERNYVGDSHTTPFSKNSIFLVEKVTATVNC